MHLVSGDNGDDSKETFFLPHHPVFKCGSNTTKLRVVISVSAESMNGQ
jgi:hypothetical protein